MLSNVLTLSSFFFSSSSFFFPLECAKILEQTVKIHITIFQGLIEGEASTDGHQDQSHEDGEGEGSGDEDEGEEGEEGEEGVEHTETTQEEEEHSETLAFNKQGL